MKIQPYGTRVRAPTIFFTHFATPAASAVTDAYDGTTLNPPLRPGRVGPDDTASTDATQIPPTSRAASPSSLPMDSAAPRAPVENSPRFVSRGKPFQISTMNTRTLNPTSRMHELVHAASLNINDIICIQEHRQHHQSILSYQFINRYQLITASATKNSVNATIGGVGFLVSPWLQVT